MNDDPVLNRSFDDLPNMPMAKDAEEAILFVMLADEEGARTAARLLKPQYFFTPFRKKIFRALQTLATRDRAGDALLNPAALTDALRSQGDGDLVESSMAEIAALYDPTAAPYVFRMRQDFGSVQQQTLAICEIIIRQAARRALVTIFDRSAESIAKNSGDFDKVINDLMERTRAIQAAGVRAEYEATEPIIERILQGADVRAGLATGLTELDSLLLGGGFQDDDYVVLAARPSKGKTTLTLQMVENVALAKKRILFFPLEMEREILLSRLANIRAGLTYSASRAGYSEAEKRLRRRELAYMSEWSLYFGTRSRITVDDIWKQAKLMKDREGLDLVVVDQLGLIMSNKVAESRQAEVATISRELKLLAAELKAPLLVPHQLSREGAKESRTRKMGLEHLRGSDAVGQDADTVLILQEPDPQTQTATTYQVELTIAKQRKGSVGSVQLRFDRETGSFVEIDGSAVLGISDDAPRVRKYQPSESPDYRNGDEDDEDDGYYENGERKPF